MGQQAVQPINDIKADEDVSKCANGKSIPSETFCDEKFDCEDLSDEIHCLYKGLLQ